ncbi:ribulose-5-phosphate 4-epimerase-like epimerase or aldolase [Sphaerochaeta pleomorpha str. Grapes]|uniref:Ribulose-5-phosphate 4-epimerase-like epimerase or aldolase n=2 Tax=Sphaerochaeta TaxID=399320 RepID=G8QQX1_SPHPG|nr:ribulose-5-phosphate 4-epimerase-like epimerase or aldolase [Sphaerochaeta pleomorpha str. Grapes]
MNNFNRKGDACYTPPMDIHQYDEQRRQVAAFMTRLYNRQLTTASGGNISFRINDDLFCITPSALDKASLNYEQIAIVTLEGKNLTENLKLSIETEMHRLILVNRKDCQAVVHAHPTYASAFTAITDNGKCAINTKMIAESYYILEEPEMVDYRLMGTVSLAQQVASKAIDHDVLLMENHGALTIGKSLLEAFDKMELLERAAQMTVIAATMERKGYTLSDLNANRCQELMQMKNKK